MRPPARIKDVQKLTGCLTALSRFISILAERALPFFKLLRKSGPFVWTEDAEEAFQELKRYLTSPPKMVATVLGEPLLLYIAATAEAVSMVLVAERLDPHNPRELGSSSADGSGSQDPGPVEEPRTGEAGSQLPEICPAHGDTGSQLPEAASGPHDQTVMGSRTSEVPPDLEDRELPEPAPMEIDAPDPPPREGLDSPTTDVLHQRGPPRGQDEVPGGPQAALCGTHRLQEAMPLLPGSQDLGGVLIPIEGRAPQP
jgi:hypothetical protein